MPTKASIVFVHGIWADGSCFAKVIPTLQAEGYEVAAAQHSLDTLKGDVVTVTRTLGRVRAPAIVVGLEHWDVIQDEATQEQSKSKAPMFGTSFPRYPDRTSPA